MVLNWLVKNWLELFGTLSSLIYLYFSIKQSIWLWPLGLLSSALYVFVYFFSKFYADMGLQVYYVVISVYGWYHWIYGKGSGAEKNLPISSISLRLSLILSLITLVLFVLLGEVLIHFTDSTIPWGDALTTAISITATWMLTQKIMEHWLLWVFVDALSLALYIYKDLDITAFLFFVYTLMAVVGYLQWKKEWKNQFNQKVGIL